MTAATDSPRALSGWRVLDLTQDIAGPYCGKMLADLGAEVIKVERSGGDPLRWWGPFPDGEPDPDRSGLYHYLNGGKRHVALDLGTEEGMQQFLSLVGDVHVLVEDLGPGELESLVAIDQLRERTPGLVTVRISDYGQDGPYATVPTTELTLQAASGWISGRGAVDREPVQAGGRVTEYVSGVYAALATLTALCTRPHMDEAVTVDVSRFESLVCTLSYPMLMNETSQRLGFPQPRRVSTLLGIIRAADDWVGVNALTGQHWADLCTLMELPEYIEHQIAIMSGGPERAAFFEAAERWVGARSAQEVLELSQGFRIPAAPVGNGRTVVDFPQHRERDFFRAYSQPDIEFTMPGAPYRLSATPARPASQAGPVERDRRLESSDAIFDGLRVVDLTTFWAGGYLGCYLGALGADVIKVESVQRPDGFRFTGAFPTDGDDWYEKSGLWQGANLNKRDLTLDLTAEEGRSLLLRLVESADVVMESFSARVMDNFGLTFDDLRAVKPDVIMVRFPGFGLEGPWRDYVGWAFGIEQASGMAWVTGYEDGPPTVLGGPADPIVGAHAGVGLLAALEHRRRSGEGQLVEVAQIEVAENLTAEQVIAYSLNETVQTRHGNRARGLVQGVYPAAGDDVWVAISVRDDRDWDNLMVAMGQPSSLASADLTTQDRRLSAHDTIDEVISAWTSTREPAEIVSSLRDRGVPAAKLLVAAEMYDEPQLNARDFYSALENDATGVRRYPGWPLRFSPPYLRHRSGPPTLGQHNAEILRSLGLSDEEIAELSAASVIGDRLGS